jgi:hypothetical protein
LLTEQQAASIPAAATDAFPHSFALACTEAGLCARGLACVRGSWLVCAGAGLRARELTCVRELGVVQIIGRALRTHCGDHRGLGCNIPALCAPHANRQSP